VSDAFAKPTADRPRARFHRCGDPPSPGHCKVRIKSDGTFEGTSVTVFDCEGNELVLAVNRIEWCTDGLENNPAVAKLDVLDTEVEVESELNEFKVLEVPR
jgi:hypothetical protein